MRLLAKIGLVLLLVLGSFYLEVSEVQAHSINVSESGRSVNQIIRQDSFIQHTVRQECFSETGQEGLRKCKDVLVQERNDSKVWNRLGRLFFESEKYNEAYLSFAYATHLQADYAVAWANMCAALSQLQSYEQALDACNASLKVSFLAQGPIGEKVLALNNKSIALYLLGRYQEALETSEQALVLSPEDSQANINREFTLHALTNETTDPEIESFT